MSKLLFFRHAQAAFLSDNYDQLSDHGVLQSKALGAYLSAKKVRFDKIYVGPLARQQKTHQVVAAAYGKDQYQALVNPIQLEALKEHAGPEAMRSIIDQWAAGDKQVQQWQQEILEDPSKKKKISIMIFRHFMQQWVEGQIIVDKAEIESWAQFRQRVNEGLKVILGNTGRGETVGVFTSGGTIAAIVAEAMGVSRESKIADLNFMVRNTSMTQFLFSDEQFNLVSFNELPHLPEEMVTFV